MTTKIDRYCIDGYGLPEVMANGAWVRYVDHFSFVKDLLAKWDALDEPTEEMVDAAFDADLGPNKGCVLDWVDAPGSSTEKQYELIMYTAYKAMIAKLKEEENGER